MPTGAISLRNVPSEVITDILIHLPIDANLKSVALASKQLLAPFLLGGVSFRRRHLRWKYSISLTESIWDFLKEIKARWAAGEFANDDGPKMPKSYQQAIYSEFFTDNADIDILKSALSNGNVDLASFMLTRDAEDPEARDDLALKWALEYQPEGVGEIIELLLSSGRAEFPLRNRLPRDFLTTACRLGSETLVEHLLKTGWNRSRDSGRESPFGFRHEYEDSNAPIRMASECGHEKIVKMLLADESADPWAAGLSLRIACKHNRPKVVKFLLEEKGSYTAPWAFDAFLEALTGKPKPEVVALLLSENRVDPTASDNKALVHVATRGSAENLMLLLADPRVDPNIAIQKAAEAGSGAHIAFLLADERVNPAANNNYAISAAVTSGSIESVRLLLNDERVDPSVNDNEPLRGACERGNAEMVKLLLTSAKVTPPVNCLLDAAEAAHTELFEVLLADNRVGLLDDGDSMLDEVKRLLVEDKIDGKTRNARADMAFLLSFKLLELGR